MNIAIIGAGFTGLSAAYRLKKAGHSVTIYEAASFPGGLAAGFQAAGWQWALERHYHHVFTTDLAFLQLLEKLGLATHLIFKRVRTATRFAGNTAALDSPLTLLQFSPLSVLARIRTGFGLALLKLWPFGRWFEKVTARSLILAVMGEESWRVLWQPLFAGKFGKLAREINAAWFWARIFARSASLGYYQGGFGQCAADVLRILESQGIKAQLQTPVVQLQRAKNSVAIEVQTPTSSQAYDRVLVTVDATLLLRFIKPLTQKVVNGSPMATFLRTAQQLQGLGAQTLVLELAEPFFADQTYWLNINEKGWPFLAVVEQTALTTSTPYAGAHIVYVAKYLSPTHSDYGLSAEQLLAQYQPYLEQLSPGFAKHLKRVFVHAERFAQPIVRVDHSKKLPPVMTPIEGVYWASMQHVYPFDRGINYAVAMGAQAAALMQS